MPAILSYFLATFAEQYQMPIPSVSSDALDALVSYKWPGNVRELKNVSERLVVRSLRGTIDLPDLPTSVLRNETEVVARAPGAPRSAADVLYDQLVVAHESFWSAVYAPFMSRDLTREDLRTIVRKGLEQTGGSYRLLIDLFNMQAADYKRFLNFLKKHHCHVAFQQFRYHSGTAADHDPR